MKVPFEETGKTIDEALEKAEKKLNVSREKLKYTAKEKNTGFFKSLFGKRYFLVTGEFEKNEKPLQTAIEVLKEILGYMGLLDGTEIETKEDEKNLTLNISASNKSLIIGKNGTTLDALKYMLNQIVSMKSQSPDTKRIIIDIDDYNSKRHQYISKMAKNSIKKVKESKKPVTIKPLNPEDRKIIYRTIEKDKTLFSRSFGHGYYKRINISLKNEKRPSR